jgi:hypothetical protein
MTQRPRGCGVWLAARAPAKVCVRESWRQGPYALGPWRAECLPLRGAGCEGTHDATCGPVTACGRHARAAAPRRTSAPRSTARRRKRRAPSLRGAAGGRRRQRRVRGRRPGGRAAARARRGGARTVACHLGGAVAVDLQALRALEARRHRRVAPPAGQPAVLRQAALQLGAAAADGLAPGAARCRRATSRAGASARPPPAGRNARQGPRHVLWVRPGAPRAAARNARRAPRACADPRPRRAWRPRRARRTARRTPPRCWAPAPRQARPTPGPTHRPRRPAPPRPPWRAARLRGLACARSARRARETPTARASR